MFRDFAELELEETDLEQRAQLRIDVAQPARRELGKHRVQAVVPAQGAVAQRALEAARGAFVRILGEQLVE
jgi:hypothetical protein